MNNAMLVIHPYLDQGIWVFDDPVYSLVREPFVGGMTEILNEVSREQVGGADHMTIVFSAYKFPGHQYVLEKDERDDDPTDVGTWYRVAVANQLMRGWLCPALNLYFPESPNIIYVQVK